MIHATKRGYQFGWMLIATFSSGRIHRIFKIDRIFLRFDSYRRATAAQNDEVKPPVNPEKSC